jgi:hypothetical protein
MAGGQNFLSEMFWNLAFGGDRCGSCVRVNWGEGIDCLTAVAAISGAAAVSLAAVRASKLKPGAAFVAEARFRSILGLTLWTDHCATLLDK